VHTAISLIQFTRFSSSRQPGLPSNMHPRRGAALAPRRFLQGVVGPVQPRTGIYHLYVRTAVRSHVTVYPFVSPFAPNVIGTTACVQLKQLVNDRLWVWEPSALQFNGPSKNLLTANGPRVRGRRHRPTWCTRAAGGGRAAGTRAAGARSGRFPAVPWPFLGRPLAVSYSHQP
jgi:hypothetical protein